MEGLFLTASFQAIRLLIQMVAEAKAEAFARFFGAMLDEGVLLPPSQFEAWFLGAQHTDADIDSTVAAARKAFRA